jgi:hypothetical protein
MPFQYAEPTGYEVLTTFDHGKTTVSVYKGQDREHAIRTTNFWDERQDTWFIDNNNLPQDALSVAHRKLDALAEYIKTA